MTWAIRRAQRKPSRSLYAAVMGPGFDSTRILHEVRGHLKVDVPGRPDRSIAGHGAMVFLTDGEFSWVIVERGRKLARRRIEPRWVYDFDISDGALRITYLPPPILRYNRGDGCRPDVLPMSSLTLVSDDADGLAALARLDPRGA